MTPMISLICLDDLSMPVIAAIASRTTSPLLSASTLAVETMSRACLAPSAVFFTVTVISSSAAAVSSRLEACCSVRRDRSSAAVEISPVPARIACVLALTAAIDCSSASSEALKSTRSGSRAGMNSASMRCSRLPSAKRLKPVAIWFTAL